ncbi:MAG: HAMP domain-containing sensor histidine kinase [Campylobacterota bacterium]|nr:HAMP domain-containing sensor histidine kinase [Campylobacterota bacterium]
MNVITLLLAAVFLITTIVLYLRYQKSQKEIEALHKKLHDLENTLEDEHHDSEIFYQSRLAQMGEMISMIAHQWRQPLSAISLTAIGLETKILLKKLDFTADGEQETQAYILGRTKLIAQYVESMTTTIDDFRMFYKKDRHKELTLISEVIDRALKIIGASLETNNIAVKTECQCSNEIWVFPNELVQVFLNLLQNSQDQFLQNSTISAQITISGVDDEDGVHIEFCDNAGGINPQVIEKIFRPYFSTKDKKNGTGLGLYMCQTIVHEHHNGSLEVSSTNRGACFTLTLPLNEEKSDG